MRLISLIVAIIYLQGCTTIKVIDLAKGIEKGAIGNTADVDAIWKDDTQNQFIVCMRDSGKFPNKKGDRYMFRIPKNLRAQKSDKLVKFERRTVSKLKPKEEQHWYSWSLYEDRNDVRVYDLTVGIDEYDCDAPKANWNNLQVLKAAKDIAIDEALLFQGETIKQMSDKQEPFSIFSPQKSFNVEHVCPNTNPCLLLVSKPHINDTENPQLYYNEILSVERLVWASKPKPLWYLTIPFAVVADIAIFTVIIFVLGSAGGRV